VVVAYKRFKAQKCTKEREEHLMFLIGSVMKSITWKYSPFRLTSKINFIKKEYYERIDYAYHNVHARDILFAEKARGKVRV
jgi:hypothetical protein